MKGRPAGSVVGVEQSLLQGEEAAGRSKLSLVSRPEGQLAVQETDCAECCRVLQGAAALTVWCLHHALANCHRVPSVIVSTLLVQPRAQGTSRSNTSAEAQNAGRRGTCTQSRSHT